MRGVEMVLPCGERDGGRLVCFVLGLPSYFSRMVRVMTMTVPALSSVLLQMQFQTHRQYPMSTIHGSAAHSPDGKQMWYCGPPLVPAMLAMLAMAKRISLPIQT